MNESVSDMMRPCGPTVRNSSSLAEAALAMLSQHVREVPVVDKDDNLIGVVFAEDLFATHKDTIESIVKPARLVIPADASPIEAVRIMQKVGCEHAVVVVGDRVVGMFVWQDALERLAD
jgi:CBS domain-containing protein